MAEILAIVGTIGSQLATGVSTAGTFLASNAGLIGTALTAGGTVYSGIRAQQNAEAEAKGMKKKGDAEFAIGQRDSIRRRKETEQLMSRQRAVAAASGGSATDASVEAIMGRTQQEGDYNAMIDMYNGAVNRADLYQGARNRQKEGKGDLLGSVINAGATVYGDYAARRRQRLEYAS
jgi:hypothetical protein